MSSDLKPLVSVILPTYNRAYVIKRAVDSILQQTYSNLELIIVDDSSTDETSQIIKEIDSKRIRYLVHSHQCGANAARNTGLNASRGTYIAFQDSDDEWAPKKLALQMDALTHSNKSTMVCYCAFWRIRGKDKTYIPKVGRHITSDMTNLEKELLRGNFVTTQSLLIKKEALDHIGFFDESLPRLQDWELLIRLSQYSRFVFIDKPLVSVHLSPDSISQNDDSLTFATEMIIQKHWKLFKSNPEAMAMQFINIAIASLFNCNLKLMVRYLSIMLFSYQLFPVHIGKALIVLANRWRLNHFQ